MAAPGTARSTATGIARWQTPALIVGILGLAVSAVGLFLDPWRADFFRSWLTSYLFWFSIAAGCLAILMLQYITGGEWGLMIRRPLGAAARTMWLMALLFLPVAFGMKAIYPWTAPDFFTGDHVVHAKQLWLNTGGFLTRALIYFILLYVLAFLLRWLSVRFYENRAPETELARRKVAAGGLLVVVLTLTFVSVDWMMSLEPMWYSSMYGITFVVGCALSGMTFVIFFLTRIADTEAMAAVLKPSHLRDLGNLTLAFVMFYTYTAFSEFLLVWYGNIKEEIPHYLWREHGTWGVVAALIVLFHFFLPFFLLLMRPIKDRADHRLGGRAAARHALCDHLLAHRAVVDQAGVSLLVPRSVHAHRHRRDLDVRVHPSAQGAVHHSDSRDMGRRGHTRRGGEGPCLSKLTAVMPSSTCRRSTRRATSTSRPSSASC